MDPKDIGKTLISNKELSLGGRSTFLGALLGRRNYELYLKIKYLIILLTGIGTFYKLISSFLLPRIAQTILNKSKLSIKSMVIIDSHEDSIEVFCNLVIEETGPFPATLEFNGPVDFGFYPCIPIKSTGGDKDQLALIKYSLNTDLTEPLYFGTAELPCMEVKPNCSNQFGIKMKIKITNTENFVKFGQSLLLQDSLQMNLKGIATIYAFGLLPVNDLGIEKKVDLMGMQRLDQITVTKVQVYDGIDSEGIKMKVSCLVNNPSQIEMNLGDVNFSLYYKGSRVGSITLPDLQLSCDANKLHSLATFNPEPNDEEAQTHGLDLLSRFTCGVPTEVQIIGDHPKASKFDYWSSVLSSFKATTILAGVSEPLLRCAKLQLAPLQLMTGVLSSSAPSKLDIFNPFDTPLTVLSIEAKVYMQGQEIGGMAQDLTANPILLPLKIVTQSSQLDLKLNLDRNTLSTLYQALTNNQLKFDVEATIKALVGKFPVLIMYQQSQVQIQFGF